MEDEWERTASLQDLALNAYCTSDLFSDMQWAAEDELNRRGYSNDEIFHFSTWGDN